MQPKPFKLEQYKFLDETSWYEKFNYLAAKRINTFFGLYVLWPPVTFKRKGKWYKTPTLVELGKAIGLDDPASKDILAYHKWRLTLRAFSTLFIYVFLALPIMFFSFIVIGFLFDYLYAYGVVNPAWELASSISFIKKLMEFELIKAIWSFAKSIERPLYFVISMLLYLPIFMLLGICMRVASIIADKYFADSLCAMTIVYLVIELSRDDTLMRPSRRKEVLHRLHFLARTTLLMPLRYVSKSTDNQNWVHKHFKNMELYIRERERWAIAPKEETLEELRADFYKLVPVYLTGSYGDFDWTEEKAPKEVSLTRRQRFVAAFPRLMGFLLPILIMGYFLLRPAQAEALGLKGSVIAIILISWVLLTIDTVLRLGIVANLVNLAKGIKDLK